MINRCLSHAVAIAALFAGAPLAQAQLSDAIKGAVGGGGLGGAAMPSMDSVGVGNITGVIEYCAKNQFLGGDASSVSSGLMDKLGGQKKATSAPGYEEGLSGVLGGKSEKKVDLNSPGIKEQLTDKVCKQVLDYGKSLL